MSASATELVFDRKSSKKQTKIKSYSASQEMEKKIKELQQACEEMRKEIGQRQLEGKTLKEDLETSARQVAMDRKEHEKLVEKMESLKVKMDHCKLVDMWL